MTVTDGVCTVPETTILTVLLNVQEPLTDCTVYMVDTVGVAIGLELLFADNPVAGVHV